MFSLRAIKTGIANLFVNISIHVFYPVVIFLAFALWIILFGLIMKSHQIQNHINETEHQRYNTVTLIRELNQYTNDLVRFALLYAVNSRPEYLAAFNNAIAHQSAVAKQLKRYPVSTDLPVKTSFSASRDFRASAHLLVLTHSELALLQAVFDRLDDLWRVSQKAVYTLQGLYPDPQGIYSIKGKPDKELAQRILQNEEYLEDQTKLGQRAAELINSVNLRMQSETNDWRSSLSAIFLLENILIFIAVIICIYAYFFARHQVLKPLIELSNQAKMILLGNYHIRNQISVKNEVGDLANIQNLMCASIESDINEHKRMEAELQTSEESFRNTMENAPIGMAIVSLEGKWLQVNQALCDIIGYSKEEMYTRTFMDITHPDDMDISLEATRKLLQGEFHTFQQEKRYLRKDGSTVWVLINASIMRDENGKPLNFISQIQDISERKQSEEKLATLTVQMSSTLNELQQREQEAVIINKMNDLLQVCHDSAEAYSIITTTAQELFPRFNGGLAIYNIKSKHLETVSQWGDSHLLKSVFSTDDCWAIRSGHNLIIDHHKKTISCHHFLSPPRNGYFDAPLIVQGKLIGLFHLNDTINLVDTENLQQLLTSFSEVIKLSLANIQLREALQEQAIRDPLTGLYNRRYLDETLPREIRRVQRENTPLTVAMLDLDHFKQINDTLGHEVGDDLLKQAGKLFQDNMRYSDIACRYGGDEFVFVIFHSSLNDAASRLNTIREKNQTDIIAPSGSSRTVNLGFHRHRPVSGAWQQHGGPAARSG
ncbi:putative diguanylate cyclase YegE [Aquicella siphonis]|uniref:Putative diguanylate cyclase YegE n=1 Tax=Aquicella siphonis TaxID=254247 RepID=A0A5E4PIN8_9COXI|nr:diguanylate cyclase [Aquicella siphonis]VVC76435.1 putative diguanylate cyclase YegE [Aquicella siphonis]